MDVFALKGFLDALVLLSAHSLEALSEMPDTEKRRHVMKHLEPMHQMLRNQSDLIQDVLLRNRG